MAQSAAAVRNIVVTGGGTGIGRAISMRFAEAGHAVTIVGRRREVLHAAVEEIRAEHGWTSPRWSATWPIPTTSRRRCRSCPSGSTCWSTTPAAGSWPWAPGRTACWPAGAATSSATC